MMQPLLRTGEITQAASPQCLRDDGVAGEIGAASGLRQNGLLDGCLKLSCPPRVAGPAMHNVVFALDLQAKSRTWFLW